ncbi:MAG: 3-isopropylmalate dehydratase small subunit [Clostridia bacterium]|nr:3-isopropylmalate dehydratase small subunit [Oscillospiraceae bacterium]MBQ2772748.1 3-isopropylmalate dehydratase small subunit [Clostridia bacterium]MBQ3056020.1 3-isopropylmalate dehydratase small subunit [Clostridia bacterium]
MYQGTAFQYGDNVDTDVIIPARYLNAPSAEELAKHCMEDIDVNFVKEVKKGDIMIGGENFGCGSSREHAPIAIRASGISCVIAASFARIFYRNAINIGFPILECPEAAAKIKKGDAVTVDADQGIIKNETTGEVFHATPFPAFINRIIENGGLLPYLVNKEAGK